MAETKFLKVLSEASDDPFYAIKVGKDTSQFYAGDIVCLCCGGISEYDEVISTREVPAGANELYDQGSPIIYLFYIQKWCKDHGYSLKDVFKQVNGSEKGTVSEVVGEFEEHGFNGELYVCYDEFMDDYLGDPEYALAILNDYVEYLTEDEKEENK